MHLQPFPFDYKLMSLPPYKLEWADVLEIYRHNEEHLEHWKKYWESQGYKSWEKWREKYIRRFGLRHLGWEMLELTYPFAVDYFRGADFMGWQKLTGEKHLTFGQMATLEPIQKYEPLRDLIRNFPSEINLIGILHENNIFIIEGMHRCAAYSLALRKGNVCDTKIKMALGRKYKLFRPLLLGKRI